ncbi:MAG: hypothetical protein M1289_02205 [Patescibacteria group bacterium]|nr:hypothetical protein [Patescibacteria group bacterium]
MKTRKVGQDLASIIKRNYQVYKPSIAPVSLKMFWLSIAVTISFVLSQIYLSIFR